jgi:hypothetical protein
MSRSVRFAAALLILAALTCGSLVALPFGSRITPAETARGDFLTAAVEWIASLFVPDRHVGDVTKPPQPTTKDGSNLDPHGGH